MPSLPQTDTASQFSFSTHISFNIGFSNTISNPIISRIVEKFQEISMNQQIDKYKLLKSVFNIKFSMVCVCIWHIISGCALQCIYSNGMNGTFVHFIAMFHYSGYFSTSCCGNRLETESISLFYYAHKSGAMGVIITVK